MRQNRKKAHAGGIGRHGRRERKREIIQERQQIPGGRCERGPMTEMNEERQLGGLTSDSVRRSDRGTVSFR